MVSRSLASSALVFTWFAASTSPRAADGSPFTFDGLRTALKKSAGKCPKDCLAFAHCFLKRVKAPLVKGQKLHNYLPVQGGFRGLDLKQLAGRAGELAPGMAVHVRVNFDGKSPYDIGDDFHHWFIYLGVDPTDGLARFADTLKRKPFHGKDGDAAIGGWVKSCKANPGKALCAAWKRCQGKGASKPGCARVRGCIDKGKYTGCVRVEAVYRPY